MKVTTLPHSCTPLLLLKLVIIRYTLVSNRKMTNLKKTRQIFKDMFRHNLCHLQFMKIMRYKHILLIIRVLNKYLNILQQNNCLRKLNFSTGCLLI